MRLFNFLGFPRGVKIYINVDSWARRARYISVCNQLSFKMDAKKLVLLLAVTLALILSGVESNPVPSPVNPFFGGMAVGAGAKGLLVKGALIKGVTKAKKFLNWDKIFG